MMSGTGSSVSRSDDRSEASKHHGRGLPESVNEALFLLITAGLGLVLNVAVIACFLASRRQRRVTNSFVIHGCALDAIKCAYCSIAISPSVFLSVCSIKCAYCGIAISLFVCLSAPSSAPTAVLRSVCLSVCLSHQVRLLHPVRHQSPARCRSRLLRRPWRVCASHSLIHCSILTCVSRV